MAAKWRTVRLGEITDWASGGTPPKDDAKYWGGTIPWISASSMHGNRYSDSELKLTEAGLARGSRLAEVGAVLLLVRGSMLHQRVPVGIATRSVAFNQDVKAIKAKAGLSPWFLFYWFLGNERNLLELVDFTGIGAGKFDTKQLQELPVNLPTLAEQEEIVAVAKALDDKIELNRRMNETLEAIARAIFKSWFVDFDPVRAKASGEPPESICRRLGLTPDLLALFPDRLVDSELGEIPEGWKIRTVEDLSLKVGMGPFGSNIKVSTFVEQGIPIISGQHLNDTMLEDNTFRFISVEHADRLASANVGRGDIVFTHAGNIGQVSYIPDHSQYERYVLSQRQFYLRCDLSQISPLFMVYFFRSPLGQHTLLANASQVGVPSIARPVSYLKSIELVTPPKLLADKYDEIVRPLHHRIASARTEIETLAGLRDTLLPKLLSGELRVPVAGAA